MRGFPDTLLATPLLANLEPPNRDLVLAVAKERSLGKDQILFHEGRPAEGFFALTEGSVKLVRFTAGGKEMLVHMVRRGQTFAEAALFGPRTYPVTAVAVEPSVVWLWPRGALVDLINSSPELALGMILSMSIKARELVGTLELLTQRRVEERLAVYLLGRAGDRLLKTGDEVVLAETKQLIAAQLGTAPEVLSRTFRRLSEAGVLSVRGDRVCILSGQRFAALAEQLGPLA